LPSNMWRELINRKPSRRGEKYDDEGEKRKKRGAETKLRKTTSQKVKGGGKLRKGKRNKRDPPPRVPRGNELDTNDVLLRKADAEGYWGWKGSRLQNH